MFILSQIFAFFGFIIVLVAMTLKNRRKLLFYKLLSTIFILCSYFSIGSLAGVLIAIVSLMRGAFALGFTYNNNLKLKRFAIFFLCFSAISLNIIFWQNGLNLLAAAISLISIFCFFQTRVFLIRLISIIVSLLEILLNVIVFNPMNIIVEIFTITSCIIGIFQHDITIFKVKKGYKK